MGRSMLRPYEETQDGRSEVRPLQKRRGATHDAGLKARLYNGSVAKAL
jgi:hypothetical protein